MLNWLFFTRRSFYIQLTKITNLQSNGNEMKFQCIESKSWSANVRLTFYRVPKRNRVEIYRPETSRFNATIFLKRQVMPNDTFYRLNQCSGITTGSYLKLIYGGSISPKFNTLKRIFYMLLFQLSNRILKHYVKFSTFRNTYVLSSWIVQIK